MSPSRLSLPQQLDIVPASEVGSILEQTDRDFVELERVHGEARAEAEEAEALASAEGVDPKSSMWTMVRLQRFLDGLREEAARDASATVEVAQQRARIRLEEAHEEAERRRLGYDPDPLVPPIRLTEPPAAHAAPQIPVAPTVAPQAPVVGAPSVVAPLLTASEPVTAPLAIDGSTFVSPSAPSSASGTQQAANEPKNHHGAAVAGVAGASAAGGALLLASPATAAPMAPTADPSLIQPPPAVPAEPVADPTVARADVVTAAPTEAAPAYVDEQFWTPVPAATAATAAAGAAAVAAPTVAPDVDTKQGRRARHQQEKAAKQAEQDAAKAAEPAKAPATAPAPKATKPAKQGFLHRIPVTAILEVLAVLLILVFILLRLS